MKRGDFFNKEDMMSSLREFYYVEVFVIKIIISFGVTFYEKS